jgi:hypothetical protein
VAPPTAESNGLGVRGHIERVWRLPGVGVKGLGISCKKSLVSACAAVAGVLVVELLATAVTSPQRLNDVLVTLSGIRHCRA